MVFTQAILPIKKFLHLKGVCLHQYLDNGLVKGVMQSQIKKDIHTLVSLTSSLGFVINIKMSELIPAQSFIFIGMDFNLKKKSIVVSVERLNR